MTDAIVARRYAGAIFALGKQQGDEALSRYGSDLAALGDMLAASPKLDAALKSPVISIDEKKAVMGKLLKKIKRLVHFFTCLFNFVISCKKAAFFVYPY